MRLGLSLFWTAFSQFTVMCVYWENVFFFPLHDSRVFVHTQKRQFVLNLNEAVILILDRIWQNIMLLYFCALYFIAC